MVLGWGKKMQKTQKDDEDMSMEEILASIRKYVTDDYNPSKQEAVPSGISQPQKNDQAVIHTEESPTVSASAHESEETDILDLVDMIEPSTHIDLEANPSAPVQANEAHHDVLAMSLSSATQQHSGEKGKEESTLSPVSSSSLKQPENTGFNEGASEISPSATLSGKITDSINSHQGGFSAQAPTHTNHLKTTLNDSLSTPTFKGNPMAQIQSTPHASFHDEGLASKETVSSSSQALNKLVQAVKPQVQPVAEAARNSGNPGQTLDTLIGDLARPLVKQWIDQNLSGMVEAMVSKEIEKITKNLIK